MISILEVGPQITKLSNDILDRLLPKSGQPMDLRVTIADEDDHKRNILQMLDQGNLTWAQILLMKQAAFYTALAAIITTVPENAKKGITK